MSGDLVVDPSEARKVLGKIWETEADKLQVDVKLNTGGKRSGARIEEDKDLEADMEEVMPDVITRRILWSVAVAQYDPLGLLPGYTVRFKILMRTLTQEETGKVLDWDSLVPKATSGSFMEILSHLKELQENKIPRTIRPEAALGQVKETPMLMMFGDGSREACCAFSICQMGNERRQGDLQAAGREDQSGAAL